MTTDRLNALVPLLGRWVTVTNPQNPASWTGRLIGLADDPSVIIEQRGGPRMTLPQTFRIEAAEPPGPAYRSEAGVSEMTDDQLDALRADRDRLAATLDAVCVLHQPVDGYTGWCGPGDYGAMRPACSTCGTEDQAVAWPCPTVRAINAPSAPNGAPLSAEQPHAGTEPHPHPSQAPTQAHTGSDAPTGIVTTDRPLSPCQVAALRAAFPDARVVAPTEIVIDGQTYRYQTLTTED